MRKWNTELAYFGAVFSYCSNDLPIWCMYPPKKHNKVLSNLCKGYHIIIYVTICEYDLLAYCLPGGSTEVSTWIKRSFKKKLKHKDSFGKSENLSKIFFAEILVFDHDYEGKSSSSNGLLWISFIFFKIIYLNYISNCSEGLRTNLYTLSTILCKV